jgi:hypothetical protein
MINQNQPELTRIQPISTKQTTISHLKLLKAKKNRAYNDRNRDSGWSDKEL